MLIPLTNIPRDYAWGSTVLLAALEGRPPASAPEAEVWFGDHPSDPADLATGGTLRELTAGTLPYLLKLLAADAPLSIQAHPTLAQAREGYAREAALAPDDPARNYRDANHKPELIVALSERFDALVGLRPVADSLRLLDALGESAGIRALREILQTGEDPLRRAIAWALTDASPSEVGDVVSAIETGRAPEFAEALDAVRRAADRNPADPGVIVALLMNHVVLSPGEGVFLPAGVLHAYQGGLGVEIMAASDNVLRGGLTPKHIDVPELLAILDSAPHEVRVQRPEEISGIAAYEAPVPDFLLRRVRLDAEPVEIDLSGPAIVLVTAGKVTVRSDAGPLAVPVGSAVFATAEETGVRLEGRGQVFVAQPGERTP